MTDHKEVWCRAGSVVGLLLPLFSLMFLGTACSMLERPPVSLPNYDNSNGFILDYRVGDRFETVKPMFLTRPTGQELDLAPPGLGAPSLDQYAKEPGRFPYVVKLMPIGTLLELVAIKDAGVRTAVTFVVMEGTDEWIGVTLGEYTMVGVNHHKRYNREFFRKVGDTGDVTPQAPGIERQRGSDRKRR